MKKMYVLATALALLNTTSAFSQKALFSPSDEELVGYGNPKGATPDELTLLRKEQYYLLLCREETEVELPQDIYDKACKLAKEYREKIAQTKKWCFDRYEHEWTRKDLAVCH